MNVDYDLVLHFRNPKTKRAPADLTQLHPLGKIPILVTPSGLSLAECNAIATYLLNTYDTSSKFHESDIHSDAFYVEESLVSLGGTTIGPIGVAQLICDVAVKAPPFPINYLFSFLTSPIKKLFTEPEIKKALVYLEDFLEGKEWFGGETPKKADFILSWNFDLMVQRHWVELEPEYPRLVQWRERYLQRDAWKRALSKGNGYDLTQF